MAQRLIKPEHRVLVGESCAVAAVMTYLLAVVGWPPVLYASLVMFAAGGTAAVTVAAVTDTWTLAAPILTWTLGLTGWLDWARMSAHPWSWPAATSLLILSLALTAWTVVAYAVHHENAQALAAQAATKQMRALLARWDKALDRCGFAGVRCTTAAKTRQGHEVTLRLPKSGRITLRTLQAHMDTIATALRLPLGSVSFTEGAHAGEVVMSLDEVDIFRDDVAFPAASGLMTITKPIPVGIKGAGRVAAIDYRGMQVLVTGVTGWGKTNLLNVKLAQFTRCVDAVVWVIDLKGGRLAAPWVRPWVEGRCPRPAVDWVATTRAEAEIMLRAALAVITARGQSLIGGSKIVPTEDMPQLVIIADEIADIFGDAPQGEQEGEGSRNSVLAHLGKELTRKARSEAGLMVWATQKGTADFTGPAIKSQCKLRFALGTASESDARAVTDSVQGSKLIAGSTYPGTVLISHPGWKGTELVKVYRLDADPDKDADRIDELAETAGWWRPGPSKLDISVMDRQLVAGLEGAAARPYEGRWERSELYRVLAAPAPPAGDGQPGRAATGTAVLERPRLDVAGQFDEIVSADAQLAGLGQGPRDPRARMYGLLASNQVWGLSVAEIWSRLARDGLRVHRGTVHRWLEEDIRAGRVERHGKPRSDGARYTLRRDGAQS